jgi:hypothetical protein
MGKACALVRMRLLPLNCSDVCRGTSKVRAQEGEFCRYEKEQSGRKEVKGLCPLTTPTAKGWKGRWQIRIGKCRLVRF